MISRLTIFHLLFFYIIDAFNTTSEYLDDILNINNIDFYDMVSQIYPSELQLNKGNTSDSKATIFDYLILWIIYVISVLYLLCFCARLFINALWSPAGKGLTSWLLIVMSNCEVVTFPLVSWVRCGA